MKKSHLWLVCGATAFCAGSLFFSLSTYRAVRAISQESKIMYSVLCSDIEPDNKEPTEEKYNPSFCKSLQGIPFAEDLGILKSVKTVELNDVLAPHNASIVEEEDGYLMCFRHDVKERKKILGIKTPFRQKIPFISKSMPFRTYISAVRLDKEFKQKSPTKRIDTKSEFSEDPRLFKAGKELYVSYNDMQKNPLYSRTMYLAGLDSETLQTKFILDIDQHIQHVDQPNHVEKNWVPFVRSENGEEKIYFEYGINPHKILRMKQPQNNEMDHLIYPHEIALQKTPWKAKWGPFRGGTPARLVNGQYLAFFHTLFYEKRTPWYVMGAYTFEANPTYRVTAVSATPILFNGIYQTRTKNTAHSKKKAIYPAGIAIGSEEGKDVVHVSCGENDCTVKILTFDLEKLLESLTPIPLYTEK